METKEMKSDMKTVQETIMEARAMGVEVETDADGDPVLVDGYEVAGGSLLVLDEEDGTGAYLPLALYNGGDWDEAHLIEVDLEWPDQESERLAGWYGSDYDQPNYVSCTIRAGEEGYDYDEERPYAVAAARETALAIWAQKQAAGRAA